MSLITNKDVKLITQLQDVLNTQNLEQLSEYISNLTTELGTDSTTFAAALLHLLQETKKSNQSSVKNKTSTTQICPNASPLLIKMVRYRLNIGSDHSVNADQIKATLIEESGVDKKNIKNINIQGSYTLIELPDEMPTDIFQHLKSVEINQLKLDIKRVKPRNNKKRGNNHFRRNRRSENTSEQTKSTLQH